MNKNIEKELNKLVLKAYRKNEVPVAALIVENNNIIATAYNKRNKLNNLLCHAEIQCILKASKKRKNWRLDNCDMYVTLEPCHMCREIIKEARIQNVYYYVNNKKIINRNTKFHNIYLESNEFSQNYSKLLTSFFKRLR